MAYEEVKYRWTGDDWKSSQTAKESAGATPLPKIVLTPYGLSPFQLQTAGMEGGQVVIKSRVYLASDADKKPLAAWDIAVGDYVMLPLDLANAGQPWMRNRFYVKGETWAPRPSQASGSTVLELCQSIHATGEPQFDTYHVFSRTRPKDGAPIEKTTSEWTADAAPRALLISKLTGHWKNTEYHFEAQRQGAPGKRGSTCPARERGRRERDPGGGAGPAAAIPAAQARSAAGSRGRQRRHGRGRDARGRRPASAALRQTAGAAAVDAGAIVSRSEGRCRWVREEPDHLLRQRHDRLGGDQQRDVLAGHQLDGAGLSADGGHRQDRSALARSHAVVHPGLYGRDLRYRDGLCGPGEAEALPRRDHPPQRSPEAGQRQRLLSVYARRDGGMARGLGHRSASHQRRGGPKPEDYTGGASGAPPSLPEVESVVEDCHIDETSFTADRNEDGSAVPAYGSGIKHFVQSQEKWIDIERPFAKLEEILNSPQDNPKRPQSAEVIAALDAWASKRDTEAVSGEAGHKNAVELLHKVKDDS